LITEDLARPFRTLMPTNDPYAKWKKCACCGEWWCPLHKKHVFDCSCEPITA